MTNLIRHVEAIVLGRVATRADVFEPLTVKNSTEPIKFNETYRYALSINWEQEAVCKNSQILQDAKRVCIESYKHAIYADLLTQLHALRRAVGNYDQETSIAIIKDIFNEVVR